MLKKNFIEKKISLIEADLEYLKKYKNDTINDIASDFVKLNVVERLLEKIIMRAIDINEHLIAELSSGDEKRPEFYKDTFLMLPKFNICSDDFANKIADSAGLRNALVHDYDNIRIGDVYQSIGEAVEQYHQYCEYILKFIDAL